MKITHWGISYFRSIGEKPVMLDLTKKISAYASVSTSPLRPLRLGAVKSRGMTCLARPWSNWREARSEGEDRAVRPR